MSGYLNSLAEASLSIIERLTFERGQREEEPELDYPLPSPPSTTAEASNRDSAPLPPREIAADKHAVVRSPSADNGSNLQKVKTRSISASGAFLPPALAADLGGKKSKVTIFGVGTVGMAIAQTILIKELCDELALVDVDEEKLQGELLDLKHAAGFFPRVKVVGGLDYRVSRGSDVCVITAGQLQHSGESVVSLLGRNTGLLKKVVPALVKHSPDTVLLVVANPVDVLTHVAWKLSGLPPRQVIGSGTSLDSSRFRSLLAEALEVNPSDVQAHIVGEHGDTSVPVWSGVSIGGVPFFDFLKSKGVQLTEQQLSDIHREVVRGAGEVIRLKGYTSWAIGYSVASIVQSILRDDHKIHTVSTVAQGYHGIQEKVFLSLPCVVSADGVFGVVEQTLMQRELLKLQKSARSIHAVVKELSL